MYLVKNNCSFQTKELKESQAMRAIHFWVGDECESGTSGAAALRAAELDSQFNGGAHLLAREAQGRESARFLGYFRQRAVVVELPRDEPGLGRDCTLHRVTGTGWPIASELRPVDWTNFSSRDVLLLQVRSR